MGKKVLALILGGLFVTLIVMVGVLGVLLPNPAPGDSTDSLVDKLIMIPLFFWIAPYFFICQFLLSRGNPDAYRKDWQIMLLLNAIPAVGFVWFALRAVEGEQLTVLGRIPIFLAGTFAGAVAASVVARIRHRRQ